MSATVKMPRGRHGLSPAASSAIQRRRILDATLVLLARSNAKITAESIAKEAGISKATFYEQFANREQAIRACLREGAK